MFNVLYFILGGILSLTLWVGFNILVWDFGWPYDLVRGGAIGLGVVVLGVFVGRWRRLSRFQRELGVMLFGGWLLGFGFLCALSVFG